MSVNLEQRVAKLEKQIARLERQEPGASGSRAWLGELYGKFAHDPIFDEAMKLGRKYRRSLRARVSKTKHNR